MQSFRVGVSGPCRSFIEWLKSKSLASYSLQCLVLDYLQKSVVRLGHFAPDNRAVVLDWPDLQINNCGRNVSPSSNLTPLLQLIQFEPEWSWWQVAALKPLCAAQKSPELKLFKFTIHNQKLQKKHFFTIFYFISSLTVSDSYQCSWKIIQMCIHSIRTLQKIPISIELIIITNISDIRYLQEEHSHVTFYTKRHSALN